MNGFMAAKNGIDSKTTKRNEQLHSDSMEEVCSLNVIPVVWLLCHPPRHHPPPPWQTTFALFPYTNIYKLVETRDKGISWERYKALVCFPEHGELSTHRCRTETMAERLAHWVLHCVAINHKSLLRFIPLEHRIVLVFLRREGASW